MSMYLLQVKLSQTVTQSLVLACCALTMVGCNRTPDAKEEKNASATAQTQADNGSAVKCSSEQATSAIHTYLVNRLQQQASSQAQMIEQQASTVVDRSILQNNLNQIAVNLESVNGNQGQCRATVSFNMPQSQLDNADKIYARLRLPVVAQQVVSRGYQLQNSTVVAKNIGFGVAASGDSYQINTTTGDDLIALAGEMVANATLAQTLSQPSNLSATGNVPTTITPPPVRRDVTGNTEPKKQAAAPTTSQPKTAPTDDKTTTASAKPTSANDPAKTANSADTGKDTPAAADKKADLSTVDKTSAAITHEKVPTDTRVKLSIEEKNEQY